MGAQLSGVFNSDRRKFKNIVDPKTGFTDREIYLMRDTWNKFNHADLIDIGVAAMMKLFVAHPEIHQIFADFKDKPIEQLKDSRKFHAHCQLIMSTINNAVQAFLDGDVELFTAVLTLTGERHAARGIFSRHFECVTEPLLEAMELKLQAKWLEVEEIWTRAVKKMIEVIGSAINDRKA